MTMRIISVLLVIVTVLSVLTSCSKSFDERLDKADKLLDGKPYVIEVELDFRCDDAEMSGMFDELEKNYTTVYVKDGKMKIVNKLDINDGEKVNSFYTVYTMIDGVVYYDLKYSVDGIVSKENKYYSAITDGQRRTLVDSMCLFGGVSLDGFTAMNEKRDGDEHSAVYTGPSSENTIVIEKMLASLLEGACSNVSLIDSSLCVELEDKRYDTVVLNCQYTVVISGKTYPVGLTAELEFDYDEIFSVTLPDNTDSYTATDIENIIG